MKKVWIGAAVVLLLAVAGGLWFRQTHRLPPIINSDLADSYRQASDPLRVGKAKPDQAIRSLQKLAEQDRGNALPSYFLAAAYAQKKDWISTARELKAGNGAAYCVAYQRKEKMLDITPNFVVLREMAKNCGAAAPALGDSGEVLLGEIRKMGTRITAMEPKMIINVLVGIAIRAIADKNLVTCYKKAGRTQDAETAQGRYDTERAWAQSPQFKEDSGRNEPESEDKRLFAKYDVTEKQVTEAMAGKSQPADVQKKLTALNAELLERERTHTEKLLKSLPE